MQSWVKRFLSVDDLWSAVGYIFLIALSGLVNPSMEPASISVLAAGMLAIFWIASVNVRERNRDRYPNARVVFWGLVAVASALATFAK